MTFVTPIPFWVESSGRSFKRGISLCLALSILHEPLSLVLPCVMRSACGVLRVGVWGLRVEG
jgi:hypothetical protein